MNKGWGVGWAMKYSAGPGGFYLFLFVSKKSFLFSYERTCWWTDGILISVVLDNADNDDGYNNADNNNDHERKRNRTYKIEKHMVLPPTYSSLGTPLPVEAYVQEFDFAIFVIPLLFKPLSVALTCNTTSTLSCVLVNSPLHVFHPMVITLSPLSLFWSPSTLCLHSLLITLYLPLCPGHPPLDPLLIHCLTSLYFQYSDISHTKYTNT